MTTPVVAIEADPLLEGLDVYVVGGAVRDALLGLPYGDRDWVVVGSTPQAMLSRGFLPVGEDFPVFLHPTTQEEYALARTERKSGRGYRGFTFYAGAEVTLEEDLARRDLTINAMAQAPDGTLFDPYGGQQDLAKRRLRHVGEAFGEDPVRILRLARFAARFTDFSVASETLTLCRQMVQDGEVDHLVPERVWQELSRGLRSEVPSRMFDVLNECGALSIVMPGFVYDEKLGALIDEVRRVLVPNLPSLYALAMSETPDSDTLSKHLRTPTECQQWASLLPTVLERMRDVPALPPWDGQDLEAMYGLIERADGLRRPDRLLDLLTLACWLQGRSPQPWISALEAARGVDAGAVAANLRGARGPEIASAVRQARLAAVSELMTTVARGKAAQ